MSSSCLSDGIWYDRSEYIQAERTYYSKKRNISGQKPIPPPSEQPKPNNPPKQKSSQKQNVCPVDSNKSSAPIKSKEKNDMVNKAKAEEKRLNKSNEAKGISSKLVPASAPPAAQQGSLANEIAKARQYIKNSLKCMDDIEQFAMHPSPELVNRIALLEEKNVSLQILIGHMQTRLDILEKKLLITI